MKTIKFEEKERSIRKKMELVKENAYIRTLPHDISLGMLEQMLELDARSIPVENQKSRKYRCLRKKRTLRKVDAKASFEGRGTASDVVFREESEF